MSDRPSRRASFGPLDAVALAVTDPARTALFLDFDGTLAPFVGPAKDVVLEAGVLEVLAHLSGHLAVVGVVSGRPIQFLHEMLPVPALRLAGVYGLEEWVDGAVEYAPGVAAWLDALAGARDQLLAATEGLEGVTVKDKRVSVVVHWHGGHGATSADQRISELVAEIAMSTGLKRQLGKSAEELLPPVAVDKGAVVRRACRTTGATQLIYVGDDVGDLSAFDAVREIAGVAIAVDGAGEHTAPAEVISAADVVLEGQSEVLRWLLQLSHHLDGGDPTTRPIEALAAGCEPDRPHEP